MAAAAVLAIVVAVGEAHDPSSVALLAAAEESLGSSTSIRLVEIDAPTEARAIRVERELSASAVVVMLWKEPAHLHATLRLHVARADRWTMRSMTFDPGDTLAERGRTVGLAVASMVPERPSAPLGAVAEPTPLPPPPRAAPSLSPSPRPKSPVPQTNPLAPDNPPAATGSPGPEQPLALEESRTPDSRDRAPETEQPAQARPPAIESVRVAAPAGRSEPHAVQIGVGALAAVGIGGSAQGAGGQIEAAWFSSRGLAVRGGFAVRTGPVPALPGSDLVSAAGVGLEWWPLGDPQRATSSLGVRAGLLLLDHRVTVTGETNETQHAFLPGAEFMAQVLLGIAPRLALVGDLGLEGAVGHTDLRKGDPLAVVARIPMLRLVGGIGLRAGF
jgi:hypothetical protein